VANPIAGELVEPALAWPNRLEQLERLVLGHLDELALDLGVEEDGLGGRDQPCSSAFTRRR
jgi:hypothetical protein